MSFDAQPSDDHEPPSLFAQKYKIASMKSDIFRWNRDWDEVVRSLSSKEVHSVLAPFWEPSTTGRRDAALLAQAAQKLEEKTREYQNTVLKIFDDLDDGQIQTPWLLLEEKERKRHLMQGLGKACGSTSLGQDSRALCPEIIVRALLKQNGKAFIHFLESFHKGKKEVGEDGFYKLPNEWWDSDFNAEESSTLDNIVSVHARLTVQRNEFIGKSFLCSVVGGELTYILF